jgi:hypothetical protein
LYIAFYHRVVFYDLLLFYHGIAHVNSSLHSICTAQALALTAGFGKYTTGSLHTLACFPSSLATLTVLAQCFVIAQLGFTLGVQFGIAILGVRFQLIVVTMT